MHQTPALTCARVIVLPRDSVRVGAVPPVSATLMNAAHDVGLYGCPTVLDQHHIVNVCLFRWHTLLKVHVVRCGPPNLSLPCGKSLTQFVLVFSAIWIDDWGRCWGQNATLCNIVELSLHRHRLQNVQMLFLRVLPNMHPQGGFYQVWELQMQSIFMRCHINLCCSSGLSFARSCFSLSAKAFPHHMIFVELCITVALSRRPSITLVHCLSPMSYGLRT